MNNIQPSTKLPPLVEIDWLETHLHDPDLRILECTVFLKPGLEGVQFESGYQTWVEGHIPGSRFVDLIEELSAPKAEFPFMMPSAEQFTEVMAHHGVGEGTQVILYDRAKTMWAARVWWMLWYAGFDQAAILNGGWHKWRQDGCPVSTELSQYPPARFQAHFQPELMADMNEVIAVMKDRQSPLIHALEQDSYRKQRIPGSVNVPAMELLDHETERFLPLEMLRQRFQEIGAPDSKKIITYCGAGIASCSVAFVLTLLGYTNVSMYDGSLAEWSAHENLPIEKE
jgi:thiosulfate/3-mercaptopyruvate sulfurtransferase